jgi:hypothetical protein
MTRPLRLEIVRVAYRAINYKNGRGPSKSLDVVAATFPAQDSSNIQQ